jgi:hypothetical protein
MWNHMNVEAQNQVLSNPPPYTRAGCTTNHYDHFFSFDYWIKLPMDRQLVTFHLLKPEVQASTFQYCIPRLNEMIMLIQNDRRLEPFNCMNQYTLEALFDTMEAEQRAQFCETLNPDQQAELLMRLPLRLISKIWMQAKGSDRLKFLETIAGHLEALGRLFIALNEEQKNQLLKDLKQHKQLRREVLHAGRRALALACR